MIQNKFAFFANFAESIRATVPAEKQAEAYQAICEFGIYGTLPDDPMLKMMCLMAKTSIYNKGGAPEGNQNAKKTTSKQPQNNQKQPENNPISEEETETETEKDNLKVIQKEKTKVFQKPTFEEVEAYCKERDNAVDVARWFDYYTANGWKVGKNPMKDWRAAVRTWERSEFAAPDNRETGNYEPSPEQKAEQALMLEAIKRTEELQKKRIEARYGSFD